MNGFALPMITIGDKTINLVNVCYWEELQGAGGAKLIEIVYPGPTRCCLTAEESAEFRQKIGARSSIVTAPAMPGLIG